MKKMSKESMGEKCQKSKLFNGRKSKKDPSIIKMEMLMSRGLESNKEW